MPRRPVPPRIYIKCLFTCSLRKSRSHVQYPFPSRGQAWEPPRYRNTHVFRPWPPVELWALRYKSGIVDIQHQNEHTQLRLDDVVLVSKDGLGFD